MAIKHIHTAIANELVRKEYWNDNHAADTVLTPNLNADLLDGLHANEIIVVEEDPIFTAWDKDHKDLINIGTNTHAQIDTAVAASHTQNTDTALGAGAVAADHGAAATDQIINVCYGTGDPPDPATMTEGALWVKYTA